MFALFYASLLIYGLFVTNIFLSKVKVTLGLDCIKERVSFPSCPYSEGVYIPWDRRGKRKQKNEYTIFYKSRIQLLASLRASLLKISVLLSSRANQVSEFWLTAVSINQFLCSPFHVHSLQCL